MYSKVYVEITNICNRNCSFCPGTVRPRGRMAFETFQTIAGKLQGLTQYLYYHLMGEPLTHPDLPRMIAYAGTLGFKSIITTNGTLLPQRGRELVEAGVYKVNISVHSFEEGTREQQLRYLNDCFDFAEMATAAGVLVVLRLWNEGFDEGRNIDTLELLGQRFGREWKVERRGTRIQDHLYLEHGQRFDWPDLKAPDLGERVFCYGLKDQFAILWDGRVVPCCLDREGVLTLGSILQDDPRDLLDGPLAKEIVGGFQNRKATQELCRRCGYARRFDK